MLVDLLEISRIGWDDPRVRVGGHDRCVSRGPHVPWAGWGVARWRPTVFAPTLDALIESSATSSTTRRTMLADSCRWLHRGR